MIGKGPGVRGAVWVAVRIPDDCISAHANQSRIHQFDMNDKNNCLYSSDVISFAREKGYFTGVNKDFSFADAYAPLDFGARRYCEARVWSYFNMFTDRGEEFLAIHFKRKRRKTIRSVIRTCTEILADIQRSTFVMVAHGILHILYGDFAVCLQIERHGLISLTLYVW